jgi:hypothetical protein
MARGSSGFIRSLCKRSLERKNRSRLLIKNNKENRGSLKPLPFVVLKFLPSLNFSCPELGMIEAKARGSPSHTEGMPGIYSYILPVVA